MSYDHGQLIHEIWTQVHCMLFTHVCISIGNIPYVQAVLCGMHIWFERVSTDDNISDLPSREEYKLLEDLGAIWVPPMIAKLYTSGLS